MWVDNYLLNIYIQYTLYNKYTILPNKYTVLEVIERLEV